MLSWSMQPLKLEVSQELLPSALFGTQLLLSFEEGVGHIVSDHCEYASQQIMPPLIQAMNHSYHLLLMSGVFLLSIVQTSYTKTPPKALSETFVWTSKGKSKFGNRNIGSVEMASFKPSKAI